MRTFKNFLENKKDLSSNNPILESGVQIDSLFDTHVKSFIDRILAKNIPNDTVKSMLEREFGDDLVIKTAYAGNHGEIIIDTTPQFRHNFIEIGDKHQKGLAKIYKAILEESGIFSNIRVKYNRSHYANGGRDYVFQFDVTANLILKDIKF